MPRGAALSVQFTGPIYGTVRALLRDEGSGAAAVAVVSSVTPQGTGLASWHSVDPEATYSVAVVDAARYMGVRVDGLRASDPTRTVKLGPGIFLTVNMQWPAGSRDHKVVVPWGNQTLLEATRYSDALWQFPCLPTGKWSVEASCTVPGSTERVRTTVEARGGSTISIQVK
jgi:hypothetical protein